MQYASRHGIIRDAIPRTKSVRSITFSPAPRTHPYSLWFLYNSSPLETVGEILHYVGISILHYIKWTQLAYFSFLHYCVHLRTGYVQIPAAHSSTNHLEQPASARRRRRELYRGRLGSQDLGPVQASEESCSLVCALVHRNKTRQSGTHM